MNMNKALLITLVFLMSVPTFAQKKSKEHLKKEASVKAYIWSEKTDFNSITIPSDLEDQSAVILYREVKYIYNRPHNSIEYTKIEHEQIKLLDQVAVKDFSEFKYQKTEHIQGLLNTFILGVKIIKPSGEEIEIDVDNEAIKEEDENKLAIPNLEKGDILDYYFYSNIIVSENDLYQFDDVEDIVGEHYPILDFKFSLETEKDFFVSLNTYNNAPELETYAALSKENKTRLYGFTMQNVASNDFPRWFYPLVELPAYKFQVLFARTRKHEKKADAFMPKEVTTIKKDINKEEIFNLYEDKFSPFGNLGDVERFLKGKEFTSEEEKVKEAFYFIRHKYFTNYVEAFVVDESKIMYPYGYYKNPIIFNSDEQFIKFFAAFLKDNKIDYEILIGTKRYNGPIKDLLIEDNVDFVLKILTEKPLYIEHFNQFSTVNQINPLLENSQAYALKVVDRKHIEDIQLTSLPASDHIINNTTESIAITLLEDFSGMQIKRVSATTGHNKIEAQKDRLNFYDYIYKDHEKYGTKSVLDKVKKEKDRLRYKKEYKSLIDKQKEKQLEALEKQTASEYELEMDDYTFNVLNNGRFGVEDPLEFEEAFSLKEDLIRKAGNNYILLIGKLIGGQAHIDEEHKQRDNNIYMSYPRSYTNNISLAIPEGYSVQGLEKLNKNVENQTGGFSSEAIVNNNVLTIKTNKYYKNYFEPAANWPDMVAFLDEAYLFYDDKILLKKN
ncbi:DUF3857 domain-containing protein [Lacinutrix himadriensis]|uniref:DUF3857 domain-containing protein n=1 Tax=Lacinutrix himadriensis TaxID=641549 RepID=UPI0006E1D3AA|nr:DUF3857 domain-containing protein [Lacinutrix himadriensis]